MAPVIKYLKDSTWAQPFVIAVGQHTELLDLAIRDFNIGIDERVEIVRSRPSMMEVMGRAVDNLDLSFEALDPDCVIAQGDTSTVLAAALVAFHRRIPFVHVEAGLRTGNMAAPFPEELNRRAVALMTALHCAPTARAKAALLAEGIPPADCIMSGNTVIDALLATAGTKPQLPTTFPTSPKVIVVTAHRRENNGRRLETALTALRAIVDRYDDVAIFFPVHPSPDVRAMVDRVLGGHPRVILSEPLGYAPLVAAMQASWLVVTDSGGLQEEAPALGKPVLVLRDVTERPEALETGVVKLVGTDPETIIRAISELHDDRQVYQHMARAVFPYGDGHAAARIGEAIHDRFYLALKRPGRAQAQTAHAAENVKH